MHPTEKMSAININGESKRAIKNRGFPLKFQSSPPSQCVEISLSFLISSWVLVGPGIEFPNIEKTCRGAISTRLVFLGQKKLIGALSGASDEFLVSLKYGKSIYVPPPRKLVFSLQLTVAQCSTFRQKGMKCKN